jgi:hypothetical protein
MSAAGPPQGDRPLGGTARSAARGEPTIAAGPPQGDRPLGGTARSAARGERTSARRIVVALDTAGSAATIGTAIELARGMAADLHGLFVEDTQLLRLAALSMADEVGFPSKMRRSLDPDAMARALRAQAQRLRHDLGARLADEPVKWTFEVVRGHAAAALTKLAAERDIVLVPAQSDLAGGLRMHAHVALELAPLAVPLLVVTTSRRAAPSIAVVPPPGFPPQQIAPIVAALTGLYGRSALFAFVASEAAHLASWQRDTQALLAGHAVSSHARAIEDEGQTALSRLVAGQPARIVVALARTPESRATLLAALAMPDPARGARIARTT